MSATIRLLSYLGIVRGVWLEDHQFQVYQTIGRKTPFGRYVAHVYPCTKTGFVVLNPDGTCSGESSYIKRWKWMHPASGIEAEGRDPKGLGAEPDSPAPRSGETPNTGRGADDAG